MAPKRSPSKAGTATTSSRATQLLAKARAAAAATPAASAKAEHAAARSSSGHDQKLPGFSLLPDDISVKIQDDDGKSKAGPTRDSQRSSTTVPLPQLLKQMTSHGLTMHEAMPVAGKLIKGGFAIPEKLRLLSTAALEELGIDSVEIQKRVIGAFAGRRTAIMMKAAAGGEERPAKRRRRGEDDETLSREWGNVAGPSSRSGTGHVDFVFNENLKEEEIRGRYVLVNRAPVMTAWATVVLERLGFNRAEALSVAHCYVAHTATARGVSLGILPASARDKAVNVVGPNQPHFELMGIKIPVMQIEGEQWRGISGGECIGPERAFNYMRKSMFQTLPLVVGALTLLADSFMSTEVEHDKNVKSEIKAEADGGASSSSSATLLGPDHLHARAYSLYTQFRPDTGGEWGKRARFELDKVLALRHGHESEWAQWLAKEEEADDEDTTIKAKREQDDRGSGDSFEEDVQTDQELSSEIDRLVDDQARRDREEELRAFAASIEAETEPAVKGIKKEDNT